MLNISNNRVNKRVSLEQYESGKLVFGKSYYTYLNRFLLAFLLILLVVLFLPWTQNISGKGNVTTLKPEQRPQTVQSAIPGKIEKWYVKEGDFVNKGDTILRIAEIKSEYFDDQLMERTQEQIQAKTSSSTAYQSKIQALNRQVHALRQEKGLKLRQAKNKIEQGYLKVKSDSIDLEAYTTQLQIAQRQYDRMVSLQDEGLKAVRDVEEKRLKLQESQAKFVSQQNKLLASRNEMLNLEMDLARIDATYEDKISKAESDMYTAQSSQYDTEAEVTKLENSYANYSQRNKLLYVTAPLDGVINKALLTGIGEAFKEGEKLVRIMPAEHELAVETYIRPLDLPLIHIGEKVRVQFDGWPALVFKGWPNLSYGTYGARIVAVENFISENGKYRVLLSPDPEDHPWPEAIRVGSGAMTFALLEDVPIWYELWRQLNGFPNNYYQPESTMQKNTKE